MNFGELEKKAEQELDTEQGEKRSDQALDEAEKLLDQRTGDKYDKQLDKARDLGDEHIGQRNTTDSSQ